MPQPITIVQGAQWGSEAKGAVALALGERFEVDYAVRTGSINAGHTIVKDGKKVVFQQLPTMAASPNGACVIGPGAYVCVDTLLKELDQTEISHNGPRVILDINCGVHLPNYTMEAADAKRNLKIGATGKGCAEAVIHKIRDRGDGKTLLLRSFFEPTVEQMRNMKFTDTAKLLTEEYHRGKKILIEGTQGTLLDLHTGPYPYVTSRQTTAAAWVAEAGLSPGLTYQVVLVARTYPIRVAGNSGPMGLETDWPTLARGMNRRLKNFSLPPIVEEAALVEYENCLSQAQVAMQSSYAESSAVKLLAPTKAFDLMNPGALAETMKLFETTTVTKRLRRIAMMDVEQLRDTVLKEDPEFMVLTFLNYRFPELAHTRELSDEALSYVSDLQNAVQCWIRYVTIGPRSEDMLATPAKFYRPFRALGRGCGTGGVVTDVAKGRTHV